MRITPRPWVLWRTNWRRQVPDVSRMAIWCPGWRRQTPTTGSRRQSLRIPLLNGEECSGNGKECSGPKERNREAGSMISVLSVLPCLRGGCFSGITLTIIEDTTWDCGCLLARTVNAIVRERFPPRRLHAISETFRLRDLFVFGACAICLGPIQGGLQACA